jgi:predicted nucleic acid-binding protein
VVVSRIFWDTNLFIYLIENRGKLADQVVALRRGMIPGDQLFTSALTLGEILVKPVEGQRDDLRRRYEDVIAQAATIREFGRPAARAYAEIRQDRSIRPSDAIQLACAATPGVDLFVTNDDRLARKRVSGIGFIASLAVALKLIGEDSAPD